MSAAAALSDLSPVLTSRKQSQAPVPWPRVQPNCLLEKNAKEEEVDCEFCEQVLAPITPPNFNFILFTWDAYIINAYNRISDAPFVLRVFDALHRATMAHLIFFLVRLVDEKVVTDERANFWISELEFSFNMLVSGADVVITANQLFKWVKLVNFMKHRVFPEFVLAQYSLIECNSINTLYISLRSHLDSLNQVEDDGLRCVVFDKEHPHALSVYEEGEMHRYQTALSARGVLCDEYHPIHGSLDLPHCIAYEIYTYLVHIPNTFPKFNPNKK